MIFMKTIAFLAHTIIVYLKISDQKNVGECKILIVLATEQVAFVIFSEFLQNNGWFTAIKEVRIR